jgi:hypothetical protein
MQSVPITIIVVRSNPAQQQHYVIRFVSQLFSPGSPVSYTSKTDLQDITEILLKVALNTMNQTSIIYCIKNITVGLNFEMMCFPTPTSASFIVPHTQFFCPYVTHTTCTCIIAILCIYDIEAG